MLDLHPDWLRTVREVLGAHLPNDSVYAFGSRVRGTAKRFSDLDLVIRTEQPMTLERLGDVRAAFSESNLPIKVDVIDWSGIAPSFQRLIETEMEPVHPDGRPTP